MGSASFEFLGFSAVAIVIYNLGRSLAWRQAVLLIASLCFLATFSHSVTAWLPFVGFVLLGYAGVRTIQNGARRAFVALLVFTILAFIWLKKYTFLPAATFLNFPYISLGISYIFFRMLHLIIEANAENLPDRVGFVSYLNYTLNFTTLISGPIQRYEEFAASQLARVPPPLNVVIVGKALERIVIGFFKVNVLSLFLSMTQTEAINALLHGGQSFWPKVFTGAFIAASYPFYLYYNFSGYIDIVIGIARLMRIELPENFDRPFSSDNFINFWSRWHITLSTWLKTYVYNPLLIALMRRIPSAALEPFLGVFAFFVTFFLVGLWHGRTSVFIFFGVLQGGGVSAVKLYQVLMAKSLGRKQYKALSNGALYNAFSRGLTFTWFAFTLLWFWSNWSQIGAMSSALGAFPILMAWLVILAGSTIGLSIWEALRAWALSFEWESNPILLSRYVRTVWNTALVVIAIAIVSLMNAPAPDIVYKAF